MMDQKQLRKRRIFFLFICVLIPLALLAGVWLFRNQYWAPISAFVAILSCLPVFLHFEKGSRSGSRELAVLSVMIALSVLGRLIFQPIPGFKPVSALLILTGIAFGAEAGFVTGAMSALISNFFFGHGPWTPFQMFVWGLIGLLSGVFFHRRKKTPILIILPMGVLGGALFSLVMDFWTAVVSEGTFSWQGYGRFLLLSLPQTGIYILSNVVFLLILAKPLLEKLSRLKTKYGIFQ